MLGFHFFQDVDNPPHAFNFMLSFLQAHMAGGYPARVNRLAQSKFVLGAFNQH